jgi:AcrR family transcriptional regulator
LTSEPVTTLPEPVKRPHRADAARNFDALLAAARDAFAEHGTDASLEDIARRASVGIATLYRNFPTRQALFDTIYVGEVEDLCTAAQDLDGLEPWEAFTAWLGRFCAYVATKLAMKEELSKDSDMFRACRARMYESGEPLFLRAQAAGHVRADASLDDVVRMVAGLSAARYGSDEQRERVLRIALDGIRTGQPTFAPGP